MTEPLEEAGARLGRVLARKLLAAAAAVGAFFLFRWLDSLADTSAGALFVGVLAFALVDGELSRLLEERDR